MLGLANHGPVLKRIAVLTLNCLFIDVIPPIPTPLAKPDGGLIK